MKKLFLTLLAASSSCLTVPVFCTATSSAMQPSAWTQRYICDSSGTLIINRQDLQALLNLLYISFNRSRCTLEASARGIQALNGPWQAFQNIIQLRRNPSKDAPYEALNKTTFTQDMAKLYELQLTHRRIGKMYAATTESIVKGSLISNQQLQQGIIALRDDARKVIAQAVTDAQSYLDTILHMRSNYSATDDEMISLMHKNFNLGDFIWTLLPDMALNSFVKADETTISLSEEWWKALYKLLAVSNMIWQPIEKARAELYLAYYKTVYTIALNNGIDMSSMKIMFNEFGLLGTDQQLEQLPNPDILTV